MATADERLNEWLRDAMEEQAEVLLEGQIVQIEHYPELKARIERHLGETRRHCERLSGCLERRGEGTSPFKDAAARMVAAGQGLSGLLVGDAIVKERSRTTPSSRWRSPPTRS